jgi:hypothetical protein
MLVSQFTPASCHCRWNRCLKVSEEADDPLAWEGHSRQGLASCGKGDVEMVVLSLESTWMEGLQGYRVPLQARGAVVVQRGWANEDRRFQCLGWTLTRPGTVLHFSITEIPG